MGSLIGELSRQPALLIGIVIVAAVGGVVVGMLSEQALSDRQRQAGRAWWAMQRARGWPRKAAWTDASEQLRIVMGAAFTARPLLNRPEARLFKKLDRMVIECNPAWQVMAQVSLGEVLQSSDADAFGCVNSKRVDLLLIDEACRPRHAIEYHGTGHHQGTAAARDAVKKEALRRAGIGYHEILAGQTTPSDLKLLVEKLVDKPHGERATAYPQGEAVPEA